MPYFRIQMHPNKPWCSEEFAREGLKCMHAIGLDFDLGNHLLQDRPLDQWNDDDFQIAKDEHKKLHENKKGKATEGPTQFLWHFRHLHQGDIGLVHGGKAPVALVEVIGPYVMEPHIETVAANPPCAGGDKVHWDWPRHRFPVRIVGWYEHDEIPFQLKLSPPRQGTFQLLTGENSRTYQSIVAWENAARNREAYINMRDRFDHKFNEQVKVLEHFKQIILHGPPGTSKTYQAKRMAAKLVLPELGLDDIQTGVLQEENNQGGGFADARFRIIRQDNQPDDYQGRWAIVQFHPAYNYEDFVRGIQVSGQGNQIKYENVQRIFSAMCQAADRDPGNQYVLIIDEINRAHIAAVLGELIYGLEYRKARITTPYGIEGDYTLSVPSNLYIIGTMNTADRSIGHIDYAVRRRFAFVACPPDKDALQAYYYTSTNNGLPEELRIFAERLFDSVKELFRTRSATF